MGTHTSIALRWVTMLTVIVVTGCDRRALDRSQNTMGHQDGPPASCQSAGPLACNVNPVDIQNLCDTIKQCAPGDDMPIVSCEANTQQERPGMVLLDVTLADPVAEASYLFTKLNHQWCPAVAVLPPTAPLGGYCDKVFQIDAIGSTLTMQAERRCYQSLDQEELAYGESDVALEECYTHTFDVSHDRWVWIESDLAEGPCEMRAN